MGQIQALSPSQPLPSPGRVGAAPLSSWMFCQCISFPPPCLSPSTFLVHGTWAPWPEGQPQDFSQEVFLVALEPLQNSKRAQLPASDLAHHFYCSVNRKEKRKKTKPTKPKIDLEERFDLFNKETEEEGYLELP